MKKIALLTLASACLLSLSSSAQIAKGSTFLGGSFNIDSQNEKTTMNSYDQVSKSSGWSVSPQIGKAVDENKIVGIFLNLGGGTSERPSGGNSYNNSTSSALGGGIFYRRYFPLSSRFSLFGESSLGVNANNEERKMDARLYNKFKTTSVGLSAAPGISFRATKKLYLETSLANLLTVFYNRIKSDYYDPNTGLLTQTTVSNRFNANANTNGFSNIAIGLRWILPTKK